MTRLTLHDFIESHAKEGHTSINFNLYPKKERQFLNEGFSVQRIGPVENYPQQHLCKVTWTYAVEGTIAHKYLELAATVHPELLQQAKEDSTDSVPLPYAHPGWERK